MEDNIHPDTVGIRPLMAKLGNTLTDSSRLTPETFDEVMQKENHVNILMSIENHFSSIFALMNREFLIFSHLRKWSMQTYEDSKTREH